MTILSGGAPACVACGSEGGHIPLDKYRPRRRRRLCDSCYAAAWRRGTFKDNPIYHAQDHNAPCLGCGEHKELMARQLCRPCYGRATYHGTAKNYPACGAVPVRYLVRVQPDAPTMPPPLDPEAFGHFLWHDAEGNRAQAGVWGPTWTPEAELARDEAFAVKWLAAHPGQVVLWERSDLAMFPAHEVVTV